MSNYLFTSESVSEGHPDKVADQISDAVLDAIITKDPKARVACETFIKTGVAIVGGEITEFQLRYNSTVADVDGSVTEPDGNIIESEWVQDGNLRITVSLAEPLSVPGEHAVRHTSTDVADGDRVEAAYLFSFDPSAPPPQLEIIPDDDGFPWIWFVFGAGAVVIGALGWQLARSLKRARQQAPTTS